MLFNQAFHIVHYQSDICSGYNAPVKKSLGNKQKKMLNQSEHNIV